eukprot:Pompholyxophrys_punicea_v1_NODE_628_length_1560_cov_14.393094.p2 type:complete len:261 gc:universal NODE_628_length_1560_cov_14.393094:630-1412(+)
MILHHFISRMLLAQISSNLFNTQPRKSRVTKSPAQSTTIAPKKAPRKSRKINDQIEGYVGKAKGKKQVLWERGLWKPGMTADHDDPSMNMDKVLSSCPDFLNEISALQALFQSAGHILVMSPKCHPELAGVGIEYSWGKAKLEFRRHINDQVPAHLHQNIEKSLRTGPNDPLPLWRIRKFARRTREYRRVYSEKNSATLAYPEIEKMRKLRKCHRNILEFSSEVKTNYSRYFLGSKLGETGFFKTAFFLSKRFFPSKKAF